MDFFDEIPIDNQEGLEATSEEEEDEDEQEKLSWKIVDSFFINHSLIQQQIHSYNKFLKDIKKIFKESEEIIIDHRPSPEPGKTTKRISMQIRVQFMNEAAFTPPYIRKDEPLSPFEARIRGYTYSAELWNRIRIRKMAYDEGKNMEIMNEVVESKDSILFGKIPIMLRSDICHLSSPEYGKELQKLECENDVGGYFIIKGSERVIVAQEKQATNTPFVFRKPPGKKYKYYCEIRSTTGGVAKPISQFTISIVGPEARPNGKLKPYEMYATIPRVWADIPIIILFRALGVVEDKSIIDYVCYGSEDLEMARMLKSSLDRAREIQNQELALKFISARMGLKWKSERDRIEYTKKILRRELLPHVGLSESRFGAKAFYLGYMVNKLLSVALGRDDEDDRDHYKNKRIDTAGALMASHFRKLLFQLVKDIRKKVTAIIRRESASNQDLDIDFNGLIDNTIITDGFKYSLATGNWKASSKDADGRVGVSQALQRNSYISALSHLRRINSPIGRDGKLTKPRLLHNTHFGHVCPCESPEGQSCGLVKNLALMTLVTTDSLDDSELINRILLDEGMILMDQVEITTIPDLVKVFVNGVWVGVLDFDAFQRSMRELRRARSEGSFESYPSFAMNYFKKELIIRTDGGRCVRPLLVVENGHLKLDREHRIAFESRRKEDRWEYLVRNGLVEFLDTAEEETAMVAMKQKDIVEGSLYTFTHCEIHPAMMLGVVASIIPYLDHNQSPRNTYQSSMGKQAMGIAATNIFKRMDTLAWVLYYPQRPLIRTRSMNYIAYEDLPAGQNPMVAIACYTGYNQEDSIIMNHYAVDRGMFRVVAIRTYNCEAKVIDSQVELIEKPVFGQVVGMKHGTAYDKLDDDGIVPVGTRVRGGDVLVGKTSPIIRRDEEGERIVRKDTSVVMRYGEYGIVDKVIVTTNASGNVMVKVRVRSVRIPQIGDKFSSRHGQKGTIGMLYRGEDMPFNVDGISPDIIVNPHAIPSRMTIGQLVECLYGKLVVHNGGTGESIPFSTHLDVNAISEDLHDSGQQKRGNERMFNGFTGQMMVTQTFMGPTYYQRLKHMVDDKIHSRSKGPIVQLTKQPTEGRARLGGLRMGEMEKDCLVGHGAARFLQEKFFDASDSYSFYVCGKCGIIAVEDANSHELKCNACGNRTKFERVNVPYAAKLLFQELMSMLIIPRIQFDDGPDSEQ